MDQAKQLKELEQENKRLSASLLYMVECHAANTEGGTPNSVSDTDKRRFKEILEKAVKLMEGGWPHHRNVMADPQKTIERCRQGIERLEV